MLLSVLYHFLTKIARVTEFDAPASVRYPLVPPDGVERTAFSDGGTIDFSPLRDEKSAGSNFAFQ